MTRKQMHIRDWPEQDRAAWDGLLTPGKLLKSGGAFSHLRASTISLREQSYGHWLAFCKDSGVDLTATDPERRATDRLIQEWADSMSDLTWKTRHTRLVGLRMTLKGIAPNVPRVVLDNLCREAEWHGNRQVQERKICRILPTQEIARAGEEYLSKVTGTKFVDATQFRDGLMVASLALLTLRITNFRDLEIGRSFRDRPDGYDILLSAAETKNHRPLDKEFPVRLIPPVEQYLRIYRPILLAKSEAPHDFLWVNDWGNRYSNRNLGSRISRLTKKMLGVSISPHLFRDAAATTIARMMPSKSRAIAGALGHASVRTADKHYNQARCLDASRSYTPYIEELVEEADSIQSRRCRNARSSK